MKQNLKTKALDEKALRLSAIFGQEQIIFLNVIPTCKCSCKREVILNLKVSYVYCKSFITTTVFF